MSPRQPDQPRASWAQIKTADVLAAIGTSPVRIADVARQFGVSSGQLSGHCTHLMRTGRIRRVDRGVYVRTEVDA